MIAVFASVALALYVLIPLFILRAVIETFVPLRRAAIGSDSIAKGFLYLLPSLVISAVLFAAGTTTWQHLFGAPVAPREAYWKTILSGLQSDSWFRENRDLYISALFEFARQQAVFLVVYYVCAVLIGLSVVYFLRHFGRLRNRFSDRAKPRARRLFLFAQSIVLPRLSIWHTLLTPFVLSDPSTRISADILMDNGVLYYGRVFQHYVDADGALLGILLSDPKRFDREKYREDRLKDAAVKPESYWKVIPGNNLYLVAPHILNINLHHELDPIAKLKATLERMLKDVAPQGVNVTLSRKPEVPSKGAS